MKLYGAPVGSAAAMVAFTGTVTAGAVVSATVTVNDPEPVLPWASVAVQLTVVVPRGKVEPLGGVQLTVRTPSMLSVAEAV